MVVVKIELWPRGDESRKIHLGTATITNDGKGTVLKGDYKVKLSKWGRPKVAWKVGEVKNFPRTTRGPWDLLYCALRSILGPRNQTPTAS